MSLFGSRRGKLWLGVGTFGFFLAALAGFLLAPEGGGDGSARLYAPTILTDQFHQVSASFALTNTGEKGITLSTIATQLKTNGQWSLYKYRTGLAFALQPGESTNISGWITEAGRKWRGELVWLGHPTRLQKLRFRFQIKVGSVIPGLKPDSSAWQNYIIHTNYSPEFTY